MADGRTITVTTPLGDALAFAEMQGVEEMSQCFSHHLTLSSEDIEISEDELLGKPITVKIASEKTDRFFHGYVAEFALTEMGSSRVEYTAILRPWLWFLSRTTDNRIFQNKSAVDIVEEVLGAHPNAKFEKRLQGTYPPREYCVQYGESDLNFVERLLEDEGIFYFFEYADGEHTMVMCDDLSMLSPAQGYAEIEYERDANAAQTQEETIHRWHHQSSVVSGSYTHTDYDFEKPPADLMTRDEAPFGHPLDAGKLYHYDGVYKEVGRGEARALVRREEVQSPHKRARAEATTVGPFVGALFTMALYPRESDNVEYAILEARYFMSDAQHRAGGAGATDTFQVMYVLTPTSVSYRPPRRAPWPVMKGPQTAEVVGPAGEEIYTDEYSRVKVQFHWDRLGGKDENSTCFIRVSSVWAGSGWGFIQIPRIGQEVIVDFLEGDPDQPIITGRVYNASQMPPYDLPANATQSGWKSNSSPGGGGWNELRFEDKKGEEEVYFQAEKDHNEWIKNNESRNVDNDFLENVGNDAEQNIVRDRTETVGRDKRTTVSGNRTVHIVKNDTETVDIDRSLKVGGNETIEVDGNSDEKIWKSHSQYVLIDQSVTVGGYRMDKVGGYENRGVAGWQATTVGGYRTMSVAGYQKHKIMKNDTWEVDGDQAITIGKNQTMTINADQSFNVEGDMTYLVTKKGFIATEDDMGVVTQKKMRLEAKDEIAIICGKAKIVMKKNGDISIDGKNIDIKGSGNITMKANKISQN